MVAPSGPLRRAWIKRAYAKSLVDCRDTADDLARHVSGGRLRLCKPVLHHGRPLREETAAPGWAHGWSVLHGDEMETLPGTWSVALSADVADIDWNRTLAPRWEGISLVTGGAPILVYVKARDGVPAGGIMPGEPVRTRSWATATVARHPDVSWLDPAEFLALVPDDPDHVAEYLSNHAADFVVRATLSVGNPEDWSRLREDLVEKARAAETERKRSVVRGAVSLVAECAGDWTGRILLLRRKPGRLFVDRHPVGWSDGPYVVVQVADIDVRRTVASLCGSKHHRPSRFRSSSGRGRRHGLSRRPPRCPGRT